MTLNPNEISLNGVKYPLIDKVNPILASKQPEKQVLGDYSLETNPVISTWGQKTGRNGILLEEMDETKEAHQNRSYWSTSDDRYTTVMPPLATKIADLPNPSWVSPTGFVDSEALWNSEANAYDNNTATDATSDSIGTNAWSAFLELTIAATTIDSIKFYVGTATGANVTQIDVDLYYNGQWNNLYQGTFTEGAWIFKVVTSSPSVTSARVRFQDVGGGGQTAALGEFKFLKSTGGTATLVSMVNFNSLLYVANGVGLYKLNTAGDGFTIVGSFASGITALVAPINSVMLIFLGDSAAYWYMSTAEAFTETNVSAADIGEIWDGKAFKLDTSGNMKYTTTPNSATPTWTTADSGYSLSNFPASSVNSLTLYRDADQAYILYAGTKQGLWAYDFANSKWEKTELTMPSHATAGKGMVHWRTGLYVSSGLQVDRYIAADTAQIDSVGLNKEDGLPALRGGEIVKFIQGYDEFYALVDSTYEGATSRSTVMAYNENGWRCVWEETADNKAMYNGIVTTATRHQLIFASASGVYWIPLTKNIVSPKKVSGYTYAAAATRILPWFDGNSPGVSKLLMRFKVKSKGCSATETIIPKYRIDHTYTDLATGWTSLATIISDTITTYTFASGAGLEFKAIQPRFDLARAGATTTSPEIEWFSLEYIRSNPIVWGYQFTIDCSKDYNNVAASQLVDAIKTATELTTLAVVGWRNDSGGTETYYGRIQDISGSVQTGVAKWGQFTLMIIIP